MKSFLTSLPGWAPATDNQQRSEPEPNAAEESKKKWLDAANASMEWVNIAKSAPSNRRGLKRRRAAGLSGISLRVGLSRGESYITIMLGQDAMTVLHLKVGDCVTCEHGEGWRSIRIRKDNDHGFKLRASAYKKEDSRIGQCIPAVTKIGIKPEDAARFGDNRIVVGLDRCAYGKEWLIARW